MSRVLLIEPDLPLATTYAAALRTGGCQVDHRAGAQAAVAAADAARPDVVVMELLLAGHNGLEFLYEFRSYADWQDIPIVLLTNVSPGELAVSRTALAQLGISVHLYKPHASLGQLLRAVRGILPPGDVV